MYEWFAVTNGKPERLDPGESDVGSKHYGPYPPTNKKKNNYWFFMMSYCKCILSKHFDSINSLDFWKNKYGKN